MAMKKAEMEEHRDWYNDVMSRAQAAERSGLHRVAVQAALEAWQYVDGMMQYERRYANREFDSVKAIDIVLKYAPLLLDYESLDKLDELLSDFKRIEKNTSQCLAERLAEARARLWRAHQLYDHLEQNAGGRQDFLRRELDGDQTEWRSISESWEKMGLVFRSPTAGSYDLALVTRLGEMVPALCSACGAQTEAPKAMLLEELDCPDCGKKAWFVILSSNTPEKREA